MDAVIPSGQLSHDWMVSIHHADGSLCYHTDITRGAVEMHVAKNAKQGEAVKFFRRDAVNDFHGVHWVPTP